MFERLKEFLGIGSRPGAPDAAALEAQAAAEARAAIARAQASSAAAVNANVPVPFDLVASANQVLAQLLSETMVKRRMINPTTGQESWVMVRMPVASVDIHGPKPQETRSMFQMRGEETNNSMGITVTLQDAVGNYDNASLNHALHSVLGRIPALAGKVEFAKDAAVTHLNHEDVWKQLKPLLEQSGKFTRQELGLIDEYFETHKQLAAEEPEWSHVRMGHADGKVQMHYRPAKVNGDEKVALSSEVRLVDYFNTHKDAILPKMREKIAALNATLKDGDRLKLTPEDIAALDFTAAITKGDWGDQPTVEFGSKPVAPETALGKTKIAEFDTDKLRECFDAALMESSKEVPAIFGRIADGDMVRDLIHRRVGDNPPIHAALAHPMFNSEAEQRTKTEMDEKKGIVRVANAEELTKSHELVQNMALPHGVSIGDVREGVVRARKAIAGAVGQSVAEGVAT